MIEGSRMNKIFGVCLYFCLDKFLKYRYKRLGVAGDPSITYRVVHRGVVRGTFDHNHICSMLLDLMD